MVESMKTTLNIHYEILKIITVAAQERAISRSDLIISLLKRVMEDMSTPGDLGRLVQYQKRGKAADWHTFHIKLRVDEYEYFLDLRKLLKMSVSLILSYAVKRYLINTPEKNIGDNYPYKNYVIIRELIDNIICWKLVWGYPQHICTSSNGFGHIANFTKL
jgi:hypothetical protein